MEDNEQCSQKCYVLRNLMKVLVRAVSVQNTVKLKTKLFSINQNIVNLARRQAECGKMCTSQTKL